MTHGKCSARAKSMQNQTNPSMAANSLATNRQYGCYVWLDRPIHSCKTSFIPISTYIIKYSILCYKNTCWVAAIGKRNLFVDWAENIWDVNSKNTRYFILLHLWPSGFVWHAKKRLKSIYFKQNYFCNTKGMNNIFCALLIFYYYQIACKQKIKTRLR